MRREEYRAIFDMDGTLYRFDKEREVNFMASIFYADLKDNIYGFLRKRLGLGKEEAEREYARIKEKYRGEISLGLEAEYGFDRYVFFAETWGNLEPSDYLEPSDELLEVFRDMKGKSALLTAAPQVWATKVLGFFNLEPIFAGVIYTGEPDLRKPNPGAFQQIIDYFGVGPSSVFSIGDQEESDIAPARFLGMKTVKVGPGPTKADYQVEDIIGALQLLRKEGFF